MCGDATTHEGYLHGKNDTKKSPCDEAIIVIFRNNNPKSYKKGPDHWVPS